MITQTKIPGLLVIKNKGFEDPRGIIREVFRQSELSPLLTHWHQVSQITHTRSKPGVLRGLHANPWAKLAYPINGEIFVAIADLREDSDTFGQVETFTINDENRIALYISPGLANSYLVLGDQPMDYLYIMDDYYTEVGAISIIWNDPDLDINWPSTTPTLSLKDQKNPTMKEVFPKRYK